MSKKLSNIEIWNAKLDNSKKVSRKGLNGINYEYYIPKYGNSLEYYNDAIEVRSRKSPTSKWKNGKKPGQYQPIGDKKYFNFYQFRKMNKNQQRVIAILEIV